MSSPEPASPVPAPRPGWVDRLLKFLMTEDGVPSVVETDVETDPVPVPGVKPPVVKRTKAGDVYHL